ncbi:MAG TPA: glycosyltransferase family 2 protein [Thermoanaerobaculia bacterium]|nr:glycosyltransferase family 2 protein [Thermoanaerobaculia bacterium]
MSDADFIVLDVDGGAMLRACIDSIKRQSGAPHRIIVFDNGSRTPVRLHDAEVFRSETNLGFVGGVNAAFKHVSAPFVALINNDVVLDDDWLATVLDAMRDETVAAVQTVLRRNATTLDGAGIDISDGTYRQTLDADRAWGVSATAALFRVEALGDRVFDERFFAYYEDVELCARLHERGWQLRVIPQVKATHRGSQSAGLLGRDALRLRTRNRYWVARMHRGVGRISALLVEDLKLLARGQSSLRGMIEGLCSTL